MTAKVGIDSSFWSQRKVAQLELRTIRITAIGDELLAGHGDPRGLGWFGRVMARTQDPALRLQSFVL
ncbi:MAG: GDSL-type esterase/lipase family protein, partial [Glutamicibacter arilaitensis]